MRSRTEAGGNSSCEKKGYKKVDMKETDGPNVRCNPVARDESVELFPKGASTGDRESIQDCNQTNVCNFGL